MCSCLGRTFLVLLNSVFVILGLGVMGAGAYGMVKFSEFSDVISMGALGGVVGLGVVIALFSALGAVGACKKNKCMLGFYAVFVSIAVIGEVGCGALVLTMSGSIKNGAKDCPEGNFVDSTSCKMSEGFATGVSDFIDCTYQACCMGNTTGTGLAKLSQEACKAKNMAQKPAICEGVLKEVKIGGKSLIDCGTGDPSLANLKTFRENMFEFFSSNINVIGAAIIGFGVVQLLAIIFACFLMCKNKEEFDGTA